MLSQGGPGTPQYILLSHARGQESPASPPKAAGLHASGQCIKLLSSLTVLKALAKEWFHSSRAWLVKTLVWWISTDSGLFLAVGSCGCSSSSVMMLLLHHKSRKLSLYCLFEMINLHVCSMSITCVSLIWITACTITIQCRTLFWRNLKLRPILYLTPLHFCILRMILLMALKIYQSSWMSGTFAGKS